MSSIKETKIKNFTALAVFVLISAVFYPVLAAETTVDQLTSQKTDTQRKLDKLNQQIQSYQQQIADTRTKANTLKNEVLIYEKQIASTELQIEAKATQMEDTKNLISQLEGQIAVKTKELNENKKVLGQLLVELNEYDNEYFLKTTVGANNLSDFLDQVQYTQDFGDKIFQLVQKIKDVRAKLMQQQRDLEIQLKNLEELKKQLEATQSELDIQRNQKQALLTQTRGLERNYQRLLSVSKDEEALLQKEIEDLDSKIRAKIGNKTIKASKGILAWPMDGILTQKYGNTGFTALGYNFHNGIDVAGPAATPIYAAADGTVYATDTNSSASYGNWVAIKHNLTGPSGNGIHIVTLYAHMRSFIVKPGQQVKQGDLVGYEGNTGNTTARLYGPERGYHIHFGVYDQDGFGVNPGAYTKTYGAYKVPYGYTYNPLDFL